LDHVEQSIRARKLLSGRQGVLVAVSGGLDSMTLLYVMHKLAATHAWKLTVAHFNHQLRGRSSEGDERFVRATSARLKLTCVVERANVGAHAKERGLSVEMAARELRHQFLARTARQLHLSAIALAHHADDQVESFFLRLLRGTGGEGLAGMKWRAPSPVDSKIRLVRPLLDLGRSELEQFVRENKIRFREDASNASRDFLRNRVRHELLPLLRRRFQPALNKTVLRSMDIIGAEAEAVTQAAQAWLALKPHSISNWPVALQRRVIQLQLQRAGITADYDMIEALRVQPGKRITVKPGMLIERTESGRVRRITTTVAEFEAGRELLTLKGRAGERVFDGVQFRWRLAPVGKLSRTARQPHQEYFDADRIGLQVVLRHWQPGDRFQPIGMLSAMKLQDWFTNRKIPRARRRELIVATTATGEIFWIEGQRISERFKLTRETKRRLFWRWQRL
jgi:tRNA(Ile)-lysidine synthase